MSIQIPDVKEGPESQKYTCDIEAVKFTTKIRPYFAKLGSIELHGCRVASGITGHKLVAILAMSSNVPVSAGSGLQWTSPADSKMNLTLESPVFTFFPMGTDLKFWAASRTGNQRVLN